MRRTDAEIQQDLDRWERELDMHLLHCETCREETDTYCRPGSEISYMVTRLMTEQMRPQTSACTTTQTPTPQRAEPEPLEPQMNAD